MSRVDGLDFLEGGEWRLAARCTEYFFFEVAESGFVAAVFQFRFDGAHLRMERGQLLFGRHLFAKRGEIILGSHVLHDMREHVAEFIESDFLGHAGIVRAV